MEIPIITNRIEQNNRTFRRLNEMRQDKTKCTFTIKVGDQVISAHRDILVGSSPYFEAMLSYDTLESQTGEVLLQDVDFQCVKLCIDFIYGESVSVPKGKGDDLMFVAQMMQLDALSSAIEQSLIGAVTIDNFIDSLKTAKLFNCMKLMLQCERFASRNINRVMEMEGFHEIEFEFVVSVLQADHLKMSEKDKLDFLLKWVKSDPSRKSLIPSLLENVELKRTPVEYRRFLIERDDLIKNNLDLTHLFITSVMDTFEIRSVGCRGSNILIFDHVKTTLRLYDPIQNEITDTNFQRIGIQGHYSIASLDEEIYMLGQTRSVYSLKYVDKEAVWKRMSDMLDHHGHCPPVISTSGHLYVIGGSGSCFSDTVEMYSPQTNQWELLQHKDDSTSGAAIVAFQGSIYNMGGRVDRNISKNTSKMDIEDGKWKWLSQMNEKREGAAAVVWTNFIVVAGGFRGGEPLKSVEQYHRDMNQWTLMRSMRIPRGIFQLLSINNVLYAVGGRNNDKATGSVEKYNFDNRSWENMIFPNGEALKIYRAIIIVENEDLLFCNGNDSHQNAGDSDLKL